MCVFFKCDDDEDIDPDMNHVFEGKLKRGNLIKMKEEKRKFAYSDVMLPGYNLRKYLWGLSGDTNPKTAASLSLSQPLQSIHMKWI